MKLLNIIGRNVVFILIIAAIVILAINCNGLTQTPKPSPTSNEELPLALESREAPSDTLTATVISPVSPLFSPLASPTSQHKIAGSLPFETIEDQIFSFYKDPNPALRIVATPADVSILASDIPSTTIAAIEQVDFKRYIVIGVFQGRKPHGPAGVNINGLIFRDDTVEIHTAFVKPGEVVQPAEMSAYQIIQLEKSYLPTGQKLIFILIDNRTIVTHQKYTLS